MRISILTPSFNSAEYLERAIQSVLHQDYEDIEHIVVDGGSTDGTTDILKRYSSIKWVSEKDNGQSDAMNKAYAMSSGDLIVYLNADDFFEPNIFDTIVDFFKKNKDCDILVGNLYHEFALTGLRKEMHFEHEYKKILLHFKYGFPFNPVAYVYKRHVQEQVGLFPEKNHYAMDYWFLLESFRTNKVYKINKFFGTFYKTGHNKTSTTDSIANCRIVALNHINRYDKKLLNYYKFYTCLSKIGEIKYLYKEPFKILAYNIFFSNSITLERFKEIGFKNAWKQR